MYTNVVNSWSITKTNKNDIFYILYSYVKLFSCSFPLASFWTSIYNDKKLEALNGPRHFCLYWQFVCCLRDSAVGESSHHTTGHTFFYSFQPQTEWLISSNKQCLSPNETSLICCTRGIYAKSMMLLVCQKASNERIFLATYQLWLCQQ